MKIIGIDKDKSSLSEGNENRYLILDKHLPTGWVSCFEDAYRNYFSPYKCEVHFKNGYLVVKCGLSELQDQIFTLNDWCDTADKKFDEKLQKSLEMLRATNLEQEAKGTSALEVFSKLKF
jgi:hypothetical protein